MRNLSCRLSFPRITDDAAPVSPRTSYRRCHQRPAHIAIGINLLLVLLPAVVVAQKTETPPHKATHGAPPTTAAPHHAATAPVTSPLPSGSPAVTASPAASPSTAASPTSAQVHPAASPSLATPVPLPSGVIATGNGNQPVIIIQQQPAAPPPQPTGNSWVPGLLGIGLLVLVVVYGLRFAKQRGMTVQSGLEQLGVQMPQDGITSTVPSRPPAPPEVPLPSLADLPPPQPAAVSGANISSFKSRVVGPGSPPPVPEAPIRALTPTLLGLSGSVVGELFTLAGPLTIGREAANMVALPMDSTVSRRHARIDLENGTWTVTDLGSSNGTFVNGRRLAEPHTLHRGDEVQFGSVRFRFDG